MWRLLKAEFSYNKYLFLGAFALLLSFSLINIFEIYALEWMPWLPFFVFVVSIGANTQKERRDRLYALLPLPIRRVGLTRISFLYLVYFSIMLLWVPSFMAQSDILWDEHAWANLMSSVALLIICALILIHHDLCYFGTRKYRVIFFTLIIGYVLLIANLIALAIFYKGGEQAPPPILLLEELSVIPILYLMPIPLLFYASVTVYSRRKSYH